MPKFRDTVTGQVYEFDHEPTSAELEAKAATMGPVMPPTREDGPSGVVPGLGGMLGAVIGGKAGGKLGAGVGAAAGTGFGDLYDMFRGGAIPAPMDEAKRLATVGGVTSGLEMGLPPVLRAVGAIKNVLPRGGGVLGGGGLGWLLGHPGAGAAAGAAIEAAPKVADGIDWLGTPYKPTPPPTPADPSAISPAEQAVLAKKGYTPEMMARGKVAPPATPTATPAAPSPSLWDRAKGLGENAVDGFNALADTFRSPTPTPTPPPEPPAFARSPKTVGDIAERAGVTGQHVSSLPDASRMPDARWNAEVSAAPQRTPSLTQTAPTDPSMPWEEHMSRSAPKRAATGGGAFDSVSIEHALGGLKGAEPVAPTAPAAVPVGTHDAGLQHWIESGGTPESYAATLGRLQGPSKVGPEGFGPNTVGAAQKPVFLPKTVDEAKGMSLPEQEAWEAFKRLNPGTSDSMLNSWYTSHQLGADPNEGLDLQGKVDKLLSLIHPKQP